MAVDTAQRPIAALGGSYEPRRGKPAMVAVRATRLADLEDELYAERAEHRDFASLVDLHSRRAYRALQVGHVETVEQQVAAVISLAGRRLRQTTGGNEAA
jgi:hypothetical protein